MVWFLNGIRKPDILVQKPDIFVGSSHGNASQMSKMYHNMRSQTVEEALPKAH